MGRKLLIFIGMFIILLSCEKVKEIELKQTGLRKYPTGLTFDTDVFPILNDPNSCLKCHNNPNGKDFTTTASALAVFTDYELSKLTSFPTVPITDSINYWKQMDSLVHLSKFYLLLNGGHKDKISYTTEQSDKIYGWIMDQSKPINDTNPDPNPTPTPIALKKYPIGMKYSTDIFPIIQGSCGSCHPEPDAVVDLGSISTSYAVLSDAANGFNKLPSQPTAVITDTTNYWKQADSLVQISTFKKFISTGTSHPGGKVTYSATNSDKIFGWIIEGGSNN